MWAERMRDPVAIDQLEIDMRTGRVNLDDQRPSLYGFTQEAAGFMMLTNQLIALRAESAKNPKLKTIKGPVFPTEIIESRLRDFAARKRISVIERSQARWRERHAKVVEADA